MHVKDLTPNPKNPRIISDEKLSQLKKSMEYFGDLSGVVFNQKSGNIIGGHQRTKNLDPEAKVVITKEYPEGSPSPTGTRRSGYILSNGERFNYREVYWSTKKEKAAAISANQNAGKWDEPQLTEWMKELKELEFDLNLTMFDASEREDFGEAFISEYNRTSGTTGVDEDDVPEPQACTVKLGDLYRLGNHRLLCGDSTDENSIKRLMNGEKADMVFTDPPYGINCVNDKGFIGGGKGTTKFKKVIGDETDFDVNFLLDLSEKILIWGGNYFAHKLPKAGRWFVWDKMRGEGLTLSDCELAWSNIEGIKVKKFSVQWDGFRRVEREEKRIHPNQKPIQLFEEVFNELPFKSCLDPFSGSGSTLIACEKTNRKCFGMELDPQYCQVIIDRWEKYTGQKAVMVNSKKAGKQPEISHVKSRPSKKASV